MPRPSPSPQTLEQAKVDQLLRATDLEAKAKAQREHAEARFEDRKETVQDSNQRVERDQREREAKVEREKAERQQAVQQAARQKAEAARKADHVRKKAVEAQERQARATRIAAESEAMEHKRMAVEANGEVLDVDRTLNATKAARKQQKG